MINAQQIYNYCRELNLTGISLNKDITEECKEPFHHLFELADKLKPIDIRGERRFLWVKANRGSFEEYCKYHKDSFTYYQGGEKSGTDVDAIGDIHGCFDEMLLLIQKIENTDKDAEFFGIVGLILI